MKTNINYNKDLFNLEVGDGFSDVTRKINQHKKNNPDAKIISFGIGDVSMPIVKPVIDAMHKAVDDLANIETFSGYGNYYGLEVLRKAIAENIYNGFDFSFDEVYISNGTKSDSANILELFDINSKIYLTNPGYSVYRDGALCLNRQTTTFPLTEQNNFVPTIPGERFDLIYMCSPNNPIGNAYTYNELKLWIDYAKANNSIILYDNVYFPFIRGKDKPKTIYEIDGAKEVAIEFRSFSKSASFTGVRCSYYIIPKEIDSNINVLWKKRTMNRSNGVDYIAQKGALAALDSEAELLLKNNIDYYLSNAILLKEAFEKLEFQVWGGEDSPFMWIKIKNKEDSWEFFNFMLEKLNIIIIPGIVFGDFGDKYFRVSALGKKADIEEGIRRMSEYYEKNN